MNHAYHQVVVNTLARVPVPSIWNLLRMFNLMQPLDTSVSHIQLIFKTCWAEYRELRSREDPGFVGPEAFTTLKASFKQRNTKLGHTNKWEKKLQQIIRFFFKAGRCHKHHKNPENNIFLLINLVAHISNIFPTVVTAYSLMISSYDNIIKEFSIKRIEKKLNLSFSFGCSKFPFIANSLEKLQHPNSILMMSRICLRLPSVEKLLQASFILNL